MTSVSHSGGSALPFSIPTSRHSHICISLFQFDNHVQSLRCNHGDQLMQCHTSSFKLPTVLPATKDIDSRLCNPRIAIQSLLRTLVRPVGPEVQEKRNTTNSQCVFTVLIRKRNIKLWLWLQSLALGVFQNPVRTDVQPRQKVEPLLCVLKLDIFGPKKSNAGSSSLTVRKFRFSLFKKRKAYGETAHNPQIPRMASGKLYTCKG